MPTYVFTSPDGAEYEIGAPEGATEQEAFSRLQKQLDTNRAPEGYAPASVRMAVGNAKTAEDKLRRIRSYYPDAEPYGADNFRYTEDGVPKQYNKEGLDWQDFGEYSRVPFEIAGGGLAAIPSIAAGPFTGMGSLLTTALSYGLGAEGGGQLHDLIMGVDDSRSTLDRIKSGAYSVAANATGGPAKGSSSMGGDVLEQLANSSAKSSREAAKRAGVNLPLSQATGSRRAEALENYVESTPFGGAVINDSRQGVEDAIANISVDLSSAAPGSAQEMGDLILSNARKAMTKKRGKERELYQAVEDSFASRGNSTLSDVPVDAVSARVDELDALKAKYGEYSPLATNKPLEDMRKTFAPAREGVNPPYRALKDFRSGVGSDIDNAFLQKPGGTQKGLKDVYSNVTRDLESGAEYLGGSAGATARQTASDYTKKISRQIEELERILGVPKNAAPESISNRSVDVYKKAKNAFINNPAKTKDIFRVLDKKTRKAFLAQIIEEMGRASPGVQDTTGKAFSSANFATSWAKLKANAPENLKYFTKKQRRMLDDKADMAVNLKQAKRGVNYSGSGRVLQAPLTTGVGAGLGAMLGGPVGGVAGAATANAVPYLLGRALTSPKTLAAYQGANKMGLLNFDNAIGSAGRKLAGGLVDY